MIVFTDNEGRIKDVGITSDPFLKEVYINDENNPFGNWTIAKICCYRVEVTDGVVTMMTPYVDTRIIEHIDQLGDEVEVNRADIAYIGIMADIDLPSDGKGA